jgi:anaerobic ribonucleoside-triphosphate reductase activating protein
MKLNLHKVHFPVTTLGFGRRVGLWTQGCSIRCPGCISRDTWEPDESRAIEVLDLVKSLGAWLAQADGVTISGGEPLDQDMAINELLPVIRTHCRGDILLFSGHRHETLFSSYAHIVSQVDVLISEPYDPNAGATLQLRGSDNQHIFLLSELARTRYPANLDRQPRSPSQKLDVVVDGESVWMVGIPNPGDMSRVRCLLAKSGFKSHTSDQLPILA